MWQHYKEEQPAGNELFIWLLDFEDYPSLSRFEALLSDKEKARAARFYFERDRRAYTITRGYLKERLGDFSGLAPARIEFEYNKQGKPYWAGSPFFFNVSHSGKKGLVAISPLAPVGVDIEHFRKETTTVKIAERFFSNKEVQAFLALNDGQREEGFFNAWTRKEAFIKAAGLGLSMPLHSFDVTLTPGQEARLLDVRHPGYQAGDWLLRALPVSPPYAGAFCIKHRAPRLRLWQTQ